MLKVLVISVIGEELIALGDVNAQIRHCTFTKPSLELRQG